MFCVRIVGTNGIEITNLDNVDLLQFNEMLDNTNSVILWSHELRLFTRFVDDTYNLSSNLNDQWEQYRRSNVLYS